MNSSLSLLKRANRRAGKAKLALAALASPIVCLCLYFAVWATWYRRPPLSVQTIDLRVSPRQKAYYVSLCSGLADNPHGYPGHCYVAWSESYPIDFLSCQSRGFVPRLAKDQIASLFVSVPGIVVDHAASGNMRCFNALIVIVDADQFKKTRIAGLSWTDTRFKVGTHDCVAYADSIAECLALQRPKARFTYPQDYIAQLKQLNRRYRQN